MVLSSGQRRQWARVQTFGRSLSKSRWGQEDDSLDLRSGRRVEGVRNSGGSGAWIEENDQEGVAYEYDALGMEEAAN